MSFSNYLSNNYLSNSSNNNHHNNCSMQLQALIMFQALCNFHQELFGYGHQP